MFFNIKSTAVFTLLYALVSTVGIEPTMVADDLYSGCDGAMRFQPQMLIPAAFTVKYSIAAGLVLGLVALAVMRRYTPDYWSYRKAGITLWLGMTVLIPALLYALNFADPSARLYLFILNTVTSAICVAVMTASFKRRRLSLAIAARLARQNAEAQPALSFDRVIVNMPPMPLSSTATEQGMV